MLMMQQQRAYENRHFNQGNTNQAANMYNFNQDNVLQRILLGGLIGNNNANPNTPPPQPIENRFERDMIPQDQLQSDRNLITNRNNYTGPIPDNPQLQNMFNQDQNNMGNIPAPRDQIGQEETVVNQNYNTNYVLNPVIPNGYNNGYNQPPPQPVYSYGQPNQLGYSYGLPPQPGLGYGGQQINAYGYGQNQGNSNGY